MTEPDIIADARRAVEAAGKEPTDAAVMEFLAGMVCGLLESADGVSAGYLRLSPEKPADLNLDKKAPVR